MSNYHYSNTSQELADAIKLNEELQDQCKTLQTQLQDVEKGLVSAQATIERMREERAKAVAEAISNSEEPKERARSATPAAATVHHNGDEAPGQNHAHEIKRKEVAVTGNAIAGTYNAATVEDDLEADGDQGHHTPRPDELGLGLGARVAFADPSASQHTEQPRLLPAGLPADQRHENVLRVQQWQPEHVVQPGRQSGPFTQPNGQSGVRLTGREESWLGGELQDDSRRPPA